jgi:hypothetical protein
VSAFSTTPSEETVVTCLSGYTRTVQTATNRTVATAPAAAGGRRPRNRIGSTPRSTAISVPPTPRTTQLPRIALELAPQRDSARQAERDDSSRVKQESEQGHGHDRIGRTAHQPPGRVRERIRHA